MERLTMSLTEELAEQFDVFIHEKGYTNRSEAMRDLIRERLEQERLKASPADGHCVAALTYIYNHHQLDLAGRLAESHHEHHDLTLSTQHVHLDHDNCLETVLLRGPVKAVRTFADGVIAERGVRHGKLHMIPVAVEEGGHGHGHVHSHPIT